MKVGDLVRCNHNPERVGLVVDCDVFGQFQDIINKELGTLVISVLWADGLKSMTYTSEVTNGL